jgi:hypothetical protein
MDEFSDSSCRPSTPLNNGVEIYAFSFLDVFTKVHNLRQGLLLDFVAFFVVFHPFNSTSSTSASRSQTKNGVVLPDPMQAFGVLSDIS